jgi:hypothetical protein
MAFAFRGAVDNSLTSAISTAMHIQAGMIGGDPAVDLLLLPGEDKHHAVDAESNGHFLMHNKYFVQRGNGAFTIDELLGMHSASGLKVGDKLVAQAESPEPTWSTSEWPDLIHERGIVTLSGNVNFPSPQSSTPVQVTGHLSMPCTWLFYQGDAVGANHSDIVDTYPVRLILVPTTWQPRATQLRRMSTVLHAYALLLFACAGLYAFILTAVCLRWHSWRR